jgi:hypothetical protein
MQVPESWLGKMAGGVGVLAEAREQRYMPYVQFGGENSRRTGAHIVVGTYAYTDDRASLSVRERATVSWLSLQLPVTRWNTLHLHGGYAYGHVRKQYHVSATPYIDENRWVGLFGLTMELHRRGPLELRH